MADALDSKSSVRKGMWVRLPPPVLYIRKGLAAILPEVLFLSRMTFVPDKCRLGRSYGIVWRLSPSA